MQTPIAQLSIDNKTWSIYTNLFDVYWGAETLPQIGDTLLPRSSNAGHYLAHFGLVWTSEVPALSSVWLLRRSIGGQRVATEGWPSDKVTIE